MKDELLKSIGSEKWLSVYAGPGLREDEKEGKQIPAMFPKGVVSSYGDSGNLSINVCSGVRLMETLGILAAHGWEVVKIADEDPAYRSHWLVIAKHEIVPKFSGEFIPFGYNNGERPE